jgi:dolichol-phosphate mannosyltransferase
MDKPTVVIVMPAWNEAKNIEGMLSTLTSKIFPEITGAQMHVLVVDNKSSDGTNKVVEKYSKSESNVHLIQQGDKSGLGWAYVKGIRYAMNNLKADGVLEMDADGQHPPEFVAPMVQSFLDGADYSVGSRYVKGGSIPKEWGLSRKFVSYFGNLFIRLVWLKFSIHDVTTGFRLTRVKGVLENIELEKLMELHRFAFKVDLFHQSIKLSKKTVEVPLEFRPRTQEKSKFNFKETIATFKVAIILGIKDKARFIKFGTVGFTGYVVNASTLYLFTKLAWAGALAWALSTELAIINNYVFNNLWTFKEKKIQGLGATVKKFLQFNLTSAGALIIQTIFGSISDISFGQQYRQLALPAIVLFLVLPYNYFMYNAVIWKTWKLSKIFSRNKKN